MNALEWHALTVCQPYAELIARGEKLVENRTWPTRHRGPLAIHAGQSRSWLAPGDHLRYPHLVYGAIVCVVTVVDCVPVAQLPAALRDHPHAHGPWCWILADPRRLTSPIFKRGRQQIWRLDQFETAAVQSVLEGAPV
jgi:hypothetical protein